MMHEPKKSDLAIVAMKPANKAGRLAAEWAEPRAGAEGNAIRQSTHRTQMRVRVSQALDRVRQTATVRQPLADASFRRSHPRWEPSA